MSEFQTQLGQISLLALQVQGPREYQEDSWGYQVQKDGRLLVAVADGVGGWDRGDEASQLAIRLFTEEGQGSLQSRVMHAWKGVRNGVPTGGTTLVGAEIYQGLIRFVWAGDSRGHSLPREATSPHERDGALNSVLSGKHRRGSLRLGQIGPFAFEAAILSSDGIKLKDWEIFGGLKRCWGPRQFINKQRQRGLGDNATAVTLYNVGI